MKNEVVYYVETKRKRFVVFVDERTDELTPLNRRGRVCRAIR